MPKVVCIIPNGREAELFQPLYEELVKKGAEVVNISTGLLCCDPNAVPPEEAMDKMGMRYIPLSNYKTHNMAQVLEKENPDVVVVGSDQEYLRRAFVYASKGIGKPTLLLQLGTSSNRANMSPIAFKRTIYRLTHHFSNIMHKYIYMLRTIIALRWNLIKIAKIILYDIYVAFAIDDARGRFGCDVIVTAYSEDKKVLIERGLKPEQIFVTGNPSINIPRQSDSGKNGIRLRNELGIGTNDKVLLVLTSAVVEHGWWTQDMRHQFINGIIDSLSPLLNDSTHLVIKIHPMESLEVYEGIIKDRKEPIILRKELPLTDIINISDVVMVVAYSTTVLIASALQKPVVLLSIFDEINFIPFVEMGLATVVYDLDKLKETIDGLLYDRTIRGELLSSAKKFFDSNKEFVDGEATIRISDLILKLIGKGQQECIR